ncbi:MAG: FAD:protein FMN transferase [Bacteroidales bacterium]|nr:FAD:protein FMN transferase [Bacteroidales bacterium]
MEWIYSTRNPDIPTGYSRIDAMHTRCEILLPRMAENDARALAEAVWEMVRKADERYNRFAPGSVLSRLNRTAGKEEVEVDEEMFLILELCDTFRKATLGYFDVSVHSASRSGGGSWILDPARHTVRFPREGMSLDLGGFAKGFVLEQAARAVAVETGCAILSFGGSSTAAVGIHPLGEPWPVSVAHPYYPGRTAHTFRLQDGSLSVSGKDPRGRGHIIDPSTGNTVEKEGFVAVTGPSAMVTEVLSTALWVAPEVRRGEILSGFEGYQAWDILCLTDGNTRIMKI